MSACSNVRPKDLLRLLSGDLVSGPDDDEEEELEPSIDHPESDASTKRKPKPKSKRPNTRSRVSKVIIDEDSDAAPGKSKQPKEKSTQEQPVSTDPESYKTDTSMGAFSSGRGTPMSIYQSDMDMSSGRGSAMSITHETASRPSSSLSMAGVQGKGPRH